MNKYLQDTSQGYRFTKEEFENELKRMKEEEIKRIELRKEVERKLNKLIFLSGIDDQTTTISKP
jgi:hypothetical protein